MEKLVCVVQVPLTGPRFSRREREKEGDNRGIIVLPLAVFWREKRK